MRSHQQPAPPEDLAVGRCLPLLGLSFLIYKMGLTHSVVCRSLEQHDRACSAPGAAPRPTTHPHFIDQKPGVPEGRSLPGPHSQEAAETRALPRSQALPAWKAPESRPGVCVPLV